MDENIEAKIRYLEMIQSIMTRMSTNSFMMKGWAVTLTTGIFALSAKEANVIYFLIAYFPVVLFWFLDSYYLMLERQFKHYYDIIAEEKENDIKFNISRPEPNRNKKTFYDQCLFSTTEVFFYVPMAALIPGVVILAQYLQ